MGRKICLILFLVLLSGLGAGTALADETDQDLDYPWRAHAAPFDHLFGNMIDGHQQSQQVVGENLIGFIYIEYTGETTEAGLPVAQKVNCASGNRTVGWVVKGIPIISAKLVNKSPRIWLVDPADLPKEKGYTHFHWTGNPQKPHGLVVDEIYSGYLMKRVAPVSFFWLGGGGGGGGHSGSCGGEEGGCGGETGGCSGEEGGCTGEEGGCTGEEGGCTGEEGGCTGEEGGCTGEEGGCTGEEGGCTGEEGGCTGEEGGCTGEEGGCTGEEGGCTGEEGGCSGGGGSGGSSHGGHSGRVVPQGVDPHTNIVTSWDGTWEGCGGCMDGCSED